MATLEYILNFHGIGEPERAYEQGEEPYWISEKKFTDILGLISENTAKHYITITFDDSNKSDLEIAVPRLQSLGLTAKFFVLSGKIGTPGYLTQSDVKALADQGMEVGSHGIDHVDWRGLDVFHLSREILDSRETLHGITGVPINAAAIPFGGYNRRVLSVLKQANYKTVYTSDGGVTRPSAWLKPRTSIRKDTPLSQVTHMINHGPGFARTLKRDLHSAFKRLM